jgi:hypothetical protein
MALSWLRNAVTEIGLSRSPVRYFSRFTNCRAVALPLAVRVEKRFLRVLEGQRGFQGVEQVIRVTLSMPAPPAGPRAREDQITGVPLSGPSCR